MDHTKRHERRQSKRYPLAFPIRYRVVPRRGAMLMGAGTTSDISRGGLNFRCGDILPYGSHIEMVAQWPLAGDDEQALELKMTGFVVRSDAAGTAVRVTSQKLLADAPAVLPFLASA